MRSPNEKLGAFACVLVFCRPMLESTISEPALEPFAPAAVPGRRVRPESETAGLDEYLREEEEGEEEEEEGAGGGGGGRRPVRAGV